MSRNSYCVRGGFEHFGCEIWGWRYRVNACLCRESVDWGNQSVAVCGPYAALSLHWSGIKPNDGRILSVFLAIFFAATGDAASSGAPMVELLKEGLKRMQEIGGAELGDRTMVDAFKPALDELEAGVAQVADAARKGAIHTSTIVKANAGRATYVNAEQFQGHVDPEQRPWRGCLNI